MLDMIKMCENMVMRENQKCLAWYEEEEKKFFKWALYSFDSYLIEFHDI